MLYSHNQTFNDVVHVLGDGRISNIINLQLLNPRLKRIRLNLPPSAPDYGVRADLDNHAD